MTAVIAFAVAVLALLVGAGLGWLLALRRVGAKPSAPPQSPAPLADPIATPDGAVRGAMRPEPEAPTGDGRMTKGTLLNLILKVSHTAVAVVDEHRDVVFYNDRAEDLSLIRNELLEDQAWEAARTVLNSEHHDDVAFDFTPPLSASGFVTTGRGAGRHVESVRCLARLVGDGTERYAVVYGDDDSENQRMEATRRDFVANVSHELKTPVGAIGLLTEALLESVDDPESVRHFGQRVLAESTRMGHMVNELIALSRLQGAEKLPDLEAVSVDELVDSAVAAAQASAEAHNIDLRTDDASALHIHGDFTLLLTALNNLVANAIAYSPNGSQVTISRRQSYVDGLPMASIAVTDRGIGIAPHDQKRVFERFFRVDKARSRVTGGTGLGLAIVKHVAANHDGDIALWSKSGTGSTFTLSIPIDSDSRQTERPSDSRPHPLRTTDRVAGATPRKEEVSR